MATTPRSSAHHHRRSQLHGRRSAKEHQLLRSAWFHRQRAVGGQGNPAGGYAPCRQDRNRLESGRLEEGPRPEEGCRPAVVRCQRRRTLTRSARAKSAGITLKSEPFDSEWKTRVFEVVDRAVSCSPSHRNRSSSPAQADASASSWIARVERTAHHPRRFREGISCPVVR